MVTVVAIVFTDLLTGIGIGMAVAIIHLLKNSHDVSHQLYQEKTTDGRAKYRILMAEEVTFLNKGSITQTLRKVPDNVELEIDFSKSAIVHPDVRELIADVRETAKGKNILLRIIERNESRVKADKVLPG